MARFNFNHHVTLSANMGRLYPVGLQEVVPGDVFRHQASAFLRMSPMAAAVMHAITVRIDHIFVPHRIIWPEGYPVTWEQFITGGENNDVTDPLPTLTTDGVKGGLLDYLGIPTIANIEVSSLPVRAFNRAWNYFYRDQDLVAVRDLQDLTVPKVAWEKDYFSTARPWAQKGPDVTVPLGDKAPVTGLGKSTAVFDTPTGDVREAGGVTRSYASASLIDAGQPNQNLYMEEDPDNAGFPGIFADLKEAASAKANDIRRAFALQRFAENRARAGSRLAEYTRVAFGVRPPDGRLQEPEYLGGGRSQVNISEVIQTSPDDAGDPRFGVGDLYGHGVALSRSNAYRARFTDHGYILSLMSIRPKAMYTQGIERHWLRRDRMDFLQRELQFIGEQQVLEQEVYADGTNKDKVFGYVPRYQEYRYQRSRVTGEMRDLLDYWHLGRKFDTAPGLNASFVECDPGYRIFNDTSDPEAGGTDKFWCTVAHTVGVRRKMAQVATGRII